MDLCGEIDIKWSEIIKYEESGTDKKKKGCIRIRTHNSPYKAGSGSDV